MRWVSCFGDIPRDIPLFIYGTGAAGHRLHAILAEYGFGNIAGFIDSFAGGATCNLETLKVEEFCARIPARYLVLIASEYVAEIANVCAGHGIDQLVNSTWLVAFYSPFDSELNEFAATRRFIDRYQAPNQVAFDIGANKGLVTLLLKENASVVHAFEPNPSLHAVFATNTSHCSNVILHKFALASFDGTAVFHLDDVTTGGSSLNYDATRHRRTVNVECRTLKSFCDSTKIIPVFMKIDAEGADTDIINSHWSMIETHRPTMMFEYWNHQYSSKYQELFERLAPYYRLVRISDGIDAYSYYSKWGRRIEETTPGYDNIGCLPLT